MKKYVTNPQKFDFYRHKFILNQTFTGSFKITKLGINNIPYQSISDEIPIIAVLNNLLQKEAFNQDLNDNIELNNFNLEDEEPQHTDVNPRNERTTKYL